MSKLVEYHLEKYSVGFARCTKNSGSIFFIKERKWHEIPDICLLVLLFMSDE